MANDAMAYNPAKPDPTSVAAYIARYYRVEKGIDGEALGEIYREAQEVGEKVLAGRTGPLPLEEAINLVEQARSGQAIKLIPRDRGTARTAVASTREDYQWEAGWIEGIEGPRLGVVRQAPDSATSARIYLDGATTVDEEGRLRQSIGATLGVTTKTGSFSIGVFAPIGSDE